MRAHYVENRVWMLGNRLSIDPEASPRMRAEPEEVPLDRLWPTLFSGRLETFVRADVEPNRSLSSPSDTFALRIDFGSPALSDLKRYFLEHAPRAAAWELRGFRLLLLDVGYLHMKTIFALPEDSSAATLGRFEPVADEILNAVTGLFEPLLDPLLRHLEQSQRLYLSPTFRWGVPASLAERDPSAVAAPILHSHEDTNAINQHLFLSGGSAEELDAVCGQIASSAGVGAAGASGPEIVTGAGFRGWVGWALRVWASPQSFDDHLEDFDDVLDVDALAVMQNNLARASASACGALLDRLGADRKPSHKGLRALRRAWRRKPDAVSAREVRAIVSTKSSQFLEIRKRQNELGERQHLLLLLLRGSTDYSEGLARTAALAEEALIRAVEGVEADHLERSTRLLEVTVLGFGMLGLFSVVSDLAQLNDPPPPGKIESLKNAFPFLFGISSVSTFLLVMLGVLLAIFLLLVYRIRGR